MLSSSNVDKMTIGSVVGGAVCIGLIGWATVSAVGSTMEIGRERFAAIMATSNGGADSDSPASGEGAKDDASGKGSDEGTSTDKDEKSEAEKKADERKAEEEAAKKKAEEEEAKKKAAEEEKAKAEAEAPRDDTKWRDMVADVAAEYGITVEEIAKANGLSDVSLMYSESSLMLPDGSFLTRNGVVGRG